MIVWLQFCSQTINMIKVYVSREIIQVKKTAAFIYELQSKWQQLLPYFHDIFCGLCTNAAHYQYFEKKFHWISIVVHVNAKIR